MVEVPTSDSPPASTLDGGKCGEDKVLTLSMKEER
jgi:hypothetical protein